MQISTSKTLHNIGVGTAGEAGALAPIMLKLWGQKYLFALQ